MVSSPLSSLHGLSKWRVSTSYFIILTSAPLSTSVGNYLCSQPSTPLPFLNINEKSRREEAQGTGSTGRAPAEGWDPE